jgi:outer membrane protein assembly factor BamB
MRLQRGLLITLTPPLLLALPLTLALLGEGGLPVAKGDWLHWRGPDQNGTSRELGLPAKFGIDQPGQNNLIWKAEGIGCRSTPLVMNDRVYIINKVSEGLTEQERVMCFDAASGKVLWEQRFNVFHTDIVSSRLGWTNLAADPVSNRVFAHSTSGVLYCFDGTDGKIIWTRSLTEEFGRVTGYGGRIVSPTFDSDLVIVGMINSSWGDHAKGANRFVAFDKTDGSIVWWCELPNAIKGTYYSNPVVAVINGERLLITGGAEGGMHGIQVRTGKLVWSYTFGANVINASPVVDGSYVYGMHSEENPEGKEKGRIVCLDAAQIKDGQPKLVWEHVGEYEAGLASPAFADGRLYVCDDKAKLFCFDGKTGAKLWRFPYGRLARGAPLIADGKLYVFNVNAEMYILQLAGDKAPKLLHKQFFRNPEGTGFIETNGTPSVDKGRIFFGTAADFYCIGTGQPPKLAEPKAAPGQQQAGVGVEADAKGQPAAQLQLLPAEVTLKPGQSVRFRVRAFTAKGQPTDLPSEKAAWTLPTPPLPKGAKTPPPPLDAVLSPTGELTVSATKPAQQGYVEVQIGTLKARARVRVAAQVPYEQDFEKVPLGAVPGGWVNTQGKFFVAELEGSKVLKKVTNNPAPPIARANAYITTPDATGYTIQVDVRAARVRNKLPDAGVVANRYTLLLDGKETADEPTALRLRSWDAMPRIDVGVPFPWSEGKWYTLKLTVDLVEGKALVRGKAWLRGTPEPAKWSIEFSDPVPNRTGAAALYGYVPNATEEEAGSDIYYDNLKLTPNRQLAGN